jgi:AcrR family transcriptional regulator
VDRSARLVDEFFRTVGLDVALNVVARQAAVGVGPVFQHFPTRDDLVNAHFADLVDGAL